MGKKEVDEKIIEFGKELSAALEGLFKDILDTVETLTQEKIDMIKGDTDKQEFSDRISEVFDAVDKDIAKWLRNYKVK